MDPTVTETNNTAEAEDYGSDDEQMPPTLSNPGIKDISMNVPSPKPKRKTRAIRISRPALTGFAKPCAITQDLRDFLTLQCKVSNLGPTLTRTEVTKHFNQYILAHGLRDPVDARRILYKKDPEFSKLIQLPLGCTDLSYFNLQSAIKHLFKAP